MTRSVLFALVAYQIAATTPSIAAPAAPPERAKIDALAKSEIDQHHAVGVTVVVTRGDQVVVSSGYGYADSKAKTPATAETLYRIGSVTKQFTASAILRMVEQGKLSLDDEITKYLPSYPTQGHHITIRRLMDHTSGIKGYTELPAFAALAARPLAQDSLVALFSKEPFDFAPGDGMVYNNSAYFLLGQIIEKVSGRSYADYVQDSLFVRAGMKDSRYCSESTVMPRKVHGYDFLNGTLQKARPISHVWPFSAGSLCSTAGDLVAWTAALHSGKILSPASYQELITPGTLNDGTRLRYAKGLARDEIAGHRAIHHGGGIFGFTSYVAWLPDDSLTVVVLYNSAGPANPQALTQDIVAAVLGKIEPKAVAYSGDLAELAGIYKGVGRGAAQVLTFAVDKGVLTVTQGGPKAAPLVHIGNGVFEYGPAQFTFLRTGGKVTGVRTDFVAQNTILSRQ
jgi:CubicO group peptidase (beta-lactamase class C family)